MEIGHVINFEHITYLHITINYKETFFKKNYNKLNELKELMYTLNFTNTTTNANNEMLC